MIRTDEVGFSGVAVVNSTLKKVFVDSMNIEMDFDLTARIVTVTSKGTHMKTHLFDWFQRLKHRSSFVNHHRLHRSRISRRYVSSITSRIRSWKLIARRHLICILQFFVHLFVLLLYLWGVGVLVSLFA